MFFGQLLNLSTSASATISQAGSSITHYTLNPLHSYDHIRELDTGRNIPPAKRPDQRFDIKGSIRDLHPATALALHVIADGPRYLHVSRADAQRR